MAQKAQDFVNQSMTTAQTVISSLQQAANMAEQPENKEQIHQAGRRSILSYIYYQLGDEAALQAVDEEYKHYLLSKRASLLGCTRYYILW